jgi:hypothetical protein
MAHILSILLDEHLLRAASKDAGDVSSPKGEEGKRR